MLVAVIVGIITYAVYRTGKIRLNALVSIPLLTFYLSFVATITVIARIPSHDAQYQLTLFWTYRAIANGELHYVYEIFWNIVLFVPIGILVMLLLISKHKWVITLIVGFFLSVLIELVQLIFHRGFFEFDDMVHNTLGTLIGIGALMFIRGIGKRITGKP